MNTATQTETKSKAIPESVAKRVLAALETMRSVERRLREYFDLDTRFGGNGRYESEAWRNMQSEIERAEESLALFRKHAPANDVDAEAQIAAWGGCPALVLSGRAKEWLA